jgi:hypothetical protein
VSLKDFDVEPLTCPACGVEQNGALATELDSPAPAQGDAAICLDCGSIAVYILANGKLSLRDPSDAELQNFLRDPDIQRCIAAVRVIREGK